jgi:hypothetical protein
MSGILWVWFLCFVEGVHGEVASECPFLAAPQGYLRAQDPSELLREGDERATIRRVRARASPI